VNPNKSKQVLLKIASNAHSEIRVLFTLVTLQKSPDPQLFWSLNPMASVSFCSQGVLPQVFLTKAILALFQQ
jgi:hypothetical protein